MCCEAFLSINPRITSPGGVHLELVTNALGVLQRFLTGPLAFLLTDFSQALNACHGSVYEDVSAC